MKYIIPAKTFLIGEYSALVGGSVLGLATGPGFEVSYRQVKEAFFPFPLQSPAGQLWSQLNTSHTDIQIELGELFNNLGGFGRSTAEYLSVLIPLLINKSEDFIQIRKLYQQLSLKSGAGASGADLAIQYFGKVMLHDGTKNTYLSAEWKFKDYDFILVSTGQKIKTHEHLAALELKYLESFPKVSDPLVQVYQTGSGDDFISAVNQWSDFLEAQVLTHKNSLDLKQLLLKNENILCVKPCGALGADVVVVFCKIENSATIQESLLAMNLVVQGTSADLIPGVQSQLHQSGALVKDSYVG